MNHQSAQVVANTKVYSPQSDGKLPLLKIQLTPLIEHGEVKLVPTWKPYSYILVSLVMEGVLFATRREA